MDGNRQLIFRNQCQRPIRCNLYLEMPVMIVIAITPTIHVIQKFNRFVG